MKLLFVESLTAQAHFSSTGLPSSLLAEGRAMFDAVLADLDALPDLELLTHQDLSEYTPDAVAALARKADRTLVIAPESDLELHRLVSALEAAGVSHLNCRPEGVRTTGNKHDLSRVLIDADVPTPPTDPWFGRIPKRFPCVIKPRSGAGSQNTFRLDSPQEYRARMAPHLRGAKHTFPDATIVQDFVPGIPASMAVLAFDDGYVCLRGTRQLLSDDARFHYLGCELPLADEIEAEMRSLIDRAMAVPVLRNSLRGWVGFDMVLSDAGPVLIEINPRLTTSYLALRDLCNENLMGLLLHGDAATRPTWKPGTVTYRVATHE